MPTNTLDPALVPDTAADRAITILQARLAGLDVFTQDFSDELVDPTRPMAIGVATDATAVQENPTDFETGGTTLDAETITPVHLSKSFGLTQAEQNIGHRLERQLDINLHKLANAIMDKVMTEVTSANFANTKVIPAGTKLTNEELQDAWASVPNANMHNILLNSEQYSAFLPTYRESYQGQGGNFDGAYGFDRFRVNNRWTAAEANTIGFVCDPQALAVAGRVPATSAALSNLMINQQVIEVPGLGISVQFNMWASTSSRSVWASYDLCFGATKLDGTAGTIIASA